MDAAALASLAAQEQLTVLTHEGTEYIIIGTAHVSAESVAQVQRVIAATAPDVVAVELDAQRFEALSKDSAFRDLDIFKIIREGKTLYLLGHLAVSAYQRRMGAALGVKPGAELLAAVQAGRAAGAKIELIDRNVNTTLRRTWKNIGLWKRSMLLSSLLVGDSEAADVTPAAADGGGPAVTAETTTDATTDATTATRATLPGRGDGPIDAAQIEKLKDPHTLSEMLAEFAKAFPEVKGPLIDERDQYLASSMTDCGRGHQRVVAVVGAAHVPGMKQWIGKPVDRAKLDQVPGPSWWWTATKWLVPILLAVAFVWAWRGSKSTSFVEMMLAWILPTSIGAAGFTLAAGGRLASVLSAFVVAPIAAIHPLLGTAMVVGVVEAWRRKPSVRDCEALAEDTQSLAGFWRNPVTRILLIAVASGLGTAAGFWVGVAWVAKIV